MKNKKYILLIVTVAVFFTTVVIFLSYTIINSGNSDHNILNTHNLIPADNYNVDEINPDTTLTNEYLKIIKTNELLGISHEYAMKDAVDEIIEIEALYSASVQKGLDLSDMEFMKKYNKSMKSIKNSDRYEEIRQLYSDNGISFEDAFMSDMDYQRKKYAIDALMRKIKKDYRHLKKKLNTDFDHYFDPVKDKIINDYKKTMNYRILKKSIEEGIKQIENEKNDSSIFPYLRMIYDTGQ